MVCVFLGFVERGGEDYLQLLDEELQKWRDENKKRDLKKEDLRQLYKFFGIRTRLGGLLTIYCEKFEPLFVWRL